MLSSTFQFGMPHGLAAHVRLLEGISAFHTPKAFGGGHEVKSTLHCEGSDWVVWGVVEEVELREIDGHPALRIALAETYDVHSKSQHLRSMNRRDGNLAHFSMVLTHGVSHFGLDPERPLPSLAGQPPETRSP